jgi:Ser/Thr protein kinase RdoA (MazF antagonist)
VNTAAPFGQSAGFLSTARAALPAWGIDSGASLTLLKHRENAVFAVDIDDRRSYVLRVHRRGYHNEEELRSELLWMSALSDQGIPTPRVISTTQGDVFTRVAAPDSTEPYRCDLLSWVAGVQLGAIEEQSFGERAFIERVYQQVGRLAGQIHLHSERWRPATPFQRHSWDEEGCMGRRAVWGYFENLETLTVEELTLLRRGEKVARQRLAGFGKSRARYGLIHGDLVPENVLFDGEGCTLIDFDDAGFGWYVGEIATAVFFQFRTPSFKPALQAMVRGYRQVRELPETDLQMLDVMLFLRSLTLIGWIQTRSETETALQIRSGVIEIATTLAASLSEEHPFAFDVKGGSVRPVA